jgi:hypothetical protein
LDLSKLTIRTGPRTRATSPEDIFKSLTLRGTVENIYGPQAEALRLWDGRRGQSDNVIGMVTGGGKTLVGLLIAKSLVNETRRKVLYVCPNNQLVEQTAEHAAECGIDVATYYGQTWRTREVYDEATGPCICPRCAGVDQPPGAGRGRAGGAGEERMFRLDLWLRQRRLVQPASHRERVAAYAETMVALERR